MVNQKSKHHQRTTPTPARYRQITVMVKQEFERHKQLEEPQAALDQFWSTFNSQKPGLARNILGTDSTSPLRDPKHVEGCSITGDDAGSYASARRACIRRVLDIAHESKLNNQKFTDLDFHIMRDIYCPYTDEDCDQICLHGLKLPDPERSTEAPESCQSPTKQTPIATSRGQAHPKQEFPSTAPVPKFDDHCWCQDQYDFPSTARRLTDIVADPSFAPHAPKSNLRQLQRELDPGDTPRPRFHALVNACTTNVSRSLGYATPAVVLLWSIDLLARSHVALCVAAYLAIILIRALILNLTSRQVSPDFASSEINQGQLGNCWWIATVGIMSKRNDLLSKICVAWDQDVGVYGFLFYRDGAWTYTVVDDYLYLSAKDYTENYAFEFDGDRFSPEAKAYDDAHLTGTGAFQFAKCKGTNYTWLSFLEKAYAKAHGDYEAIVGGWSSEGLEDLTGGVGSVLNAFSLRDKDAFWNQLRRGDGEYLYGLDTPHEGRAYNEKGLVLCHGYVVDGAFEYYHLHGWRLKKTRLLRIRSVWGRHHDGVWQGPWGVGSKSWNPIATWWLQLHNAPRGVFFITYEKAMKCFRDIQQVRLLDAQQWTCKQLWTKVHVPWNPQYSPVFFQLHLTKRSEVVFALSQLNWRYYRGLHGRYNYTLAFVVRQKDGSDHRNVAHAAFSNVLGLEFGMRNNVNTSVELQPGIYDILVKVTAQACRAYEGRELPWSVEDAIKQSTTQPRKLQQLAKNYDEAYGKLQIIEPASSQKNDTKIDQKLEKKGEEKDEKTEDKDDKKAKDKHFAYSGPNEVAWNAQCGVGLRVFAKDPDMRLELHYREEKHADAQVKSTAEPSIEVKAAPSQSTDAGTSKATDAYATHMDEMVSSMLRK